MQISLPRRAYCERGEPLFIFCAGDFCIPAPELRQPHHNTNSRNSSTGIRGITGFSIPDKVCILAENARTIWPLLLAKIFSARLARANVCESLACLLPPFSHSENGGRPGWGSIGTSNYVIIYRAAFLIQTMPKFSFFPCLTMSKHVYPCPPMPQGTTLHKNPSSSRISVKKGNLIASFKL